jgi:hypothetical protein
VHQPRVERLFPAPAHFHSHVDDSVLDSVLMPGLRRLRGLAGRVRVIVAAITILLLFNLRLDWLVTEICGK